LMASPSAPPSLRRGGERVVSILGVIIRYDCPYAADCSWALRNILQVPLLYHGLRSAGVANLLCIAWRAISPDDQNPVRGRVVATGFARTTLCCRRQ
jgi:hypothetical protein